MSNLQSYKINKAIHSGRTLEETLEVLNISQKELAEKTSLTVKHISNIVNGKASITPETALKFENILGVSADFWNSLEKNYQSTLARIEHKKHLAEEVKKLEQYKETYKELVTKELIEKLAFIPKNLERITENLLKHYKVFSFDSVLGTEEVVFRRYNNGSTVNYRTIEAVIRAGELRAERVETGIFDDKKLFDSLDEIKKLSNISYKLYMPKIEKILADVGVVLIAIPGFKKTGIQGISKWLNKNKVMIILKTNGQSKTSGQFEDIFFFNLFHEIAHILKHSKKKTFLDLEDRVDSKEEIEADKFASDILMPDFKTEDLQEYKNGNSISTEKAVSSLSKKYDISESIVAGQLSHLYKNKQDNIYQVLSKYRTSISYSNYLEY